MPENLYEVLRAAATGRESSPLLTAPRAAPLSYANVFERAGSMAAALGASGVQAGDRVLARVEKTPDAVALYLACLQQGAVYVPLNPTYTADEIRFFVDDAEPTLCVFDPADPPEVAVRSETLGTAGDGSLAQLADALPPQRYVAPRAGADTACMLYTSGTTGRSKGAMLTHTGLIANGRALTELWGFSATDVLIHSLPIFHVHGLFVALHCTMLSGSEAIFLPRFDVEEILAALPRATVLMGVPTHHVRLLADERFDAAATAGMRLFTSGSAPMTETVHAAFTARTGHRILERYGMTEAGIITSNPLHGERIPGTVGFALPGYEIRVADDEGVCGPDETGIVEVRGDHLFSGYWRLPETSAAAYRPDGFFVTGDVGSLDESGRLRLEGRAGDMIISGGENVYPKDIELTLDELPGIVESAVVGIRHPDFGEAVTAFVVARDGFDETSTRAALDSALARYKHPKRYVVVDELPRNAMGKVQKSRLREEHANLYS